ncbi:MAG TPA: sulfotransferase [Nevskiaceae bacterium]|nr:sulfotransferase [Nevskiaceae bacterium]
MEALLAAAREATGIDIVDEAAIEPLTIFRDSANRDGRLSPQGAVDIEKFLHRSLVNRLRMQRDLRRHPEILEQKLLPPVIVCGVTRTGSTKTHKLLAASGNFNWLPFWMSLNPALVSGDRAESPRPRIADTEQFIAFYEQRAPEIRHIHELVVDEPEEETFSLTHSLRTPVLTGMVEAPGYIDWLMRGGVEPQFEFLATVLRYLQWQGLADPAKPWVLKSPFYSGLEGSLLNVFPGAHLVMTHRHPAVTVPSTCSLFSCFRKPYTEAGIDARAVLMGLAYPTQLHLQNRRKLPPHTFLDVHFRDIVADPAQVVQRIHRHGGLALTDTALANVMAWDRSNPQNKQGHHRYSLESYGLSGGQVEEAFKDYLQFLDETFPDHRGTT